MNNLYQRHPCYQWLLPFVVGIAFWLMTVHLAVGRDPIAGRSLTETGTNWHGGVLISTNSGGHVYVRQATSAMEAANLGQLSNRLEIVTLIPATSTDAVADAVSTFIAITSTNVYLGRTNLVGTGTNWIHLTGTTF